MLRLEKFFVVSIILFVFAGLSFCGDTDFNYGDVGQDVTDISFYTPPADNETYEIDSILSKAKKSLGVKNVIYLIGDGMGPAQVALARTKAMGVDGKLYMEKLPIKGEIRTHAANSTVTDSAAAGTALACGIKANCGALGLAPDGTAYESIMQVAKHEKGMKTALVVTCTMSHATPASFASNVKSRGMEAEISAQMLENRVNVMLGGGKQWWLPKSFEGSKRADERNLVEEAQSHGYVLVNDLGELSKVSGDYVLGLFQMDALTTFSPEPSLPQMTEAAIRILTEKQKKDGNVLGNIFQRVSPDKGFFMMVEGSQIDWACHANNADNSIKQTLLFDQAVKAAIDFARKDGNTLVIVTADHETGGLTINGGDLKGENVEVKWTTGGHTALPVPLYAFGPGAEKFSGVMDNTDVPKRIAELLGIKEFPKIKK